MKILLIDSENYANVVNADPSAQVIYFYSCSDKELEKRTHNIKNLTCVKCTSSGKDSMDIQIAFYLGKHLCKKNQYIIYSADKGYDAMIALANSNGYKVTRENPHVYASLSKDNCIPVRKKDTIAAKYAKDIEIFLTSKDENISVSVSKDKAIKAVSYLIGREINVGRKKVSLYLRTSKVEKTADKIAAGIAKEFAVNVDNMAKAYCKLAQQIFN